MKSHFPKTRRGFVNQTFGVLTVLVGISAYLGTMTIQRNIMGKRRERDAKFDLVSQTGVESMLVAYRLAEISYVKAISPCATGAAPFLQALKSGHGCATLPSINVFVPTDSSLTDLVYDYVTPGGCTISEKSSTCGSGEKDLIDVGEIDDKKKVDGVTYRFFLTAVQPTKQLAEFVMRVKHQALGTTARRSFGIRPTFANSAHIEFDGRVTQENPDPLARCEGTAWGSYLYFDEAERKCTRFNQLGGGTGLVYYQGRYFGYRPQDRRFLELTATSNPTLSLFVDPVTGVSGLGAKFIKYDPDTLLNVDDLTTIDDQLYYVSGMGDSAQIGLVVGTTKTEVCNLGSQGYGQPYVGIAALSWSDPLKPSGLEVVAPAVRYAVFFLKTDLGDLFTAVVLGTSTGGPYTCSVFKEQNAQVDEYRRTYGFDRTSDSKPYFLY